MGSGRLLGLLGVLVYVLFTLLPDSSTEMLRWPWVLIWQTGLCCFVFAVLINLARRHQPFLLLGNKLDWSIGLIFVSLSLSTIWAQFPQQALWNSLIGFALLATVYFVNNYLHHSQNLARLLTFQGVLSLVFIVEGLTLWTTQTLLPALTKISQLRELGITTNSFNFIEIESRNWAPLGHQNYVAGYLMLALPILMGLTITRKGWERWIWLTGVGLGLVHLYTTNSRAGFVGLGVLLVAGLLMGLSSAGLKRWQVAFLGGLGSISIATVLVLSIDRLRDTVSSLGTNDLFRKITLAVGWQIGLDRWLVGSAPGSTPLLYQQYRPDWAGREAEMVFQLHSTPVQLWAELGVVGVVAVSVTVLVLLGLLVRLHSSPSWQIDRQDQIITYSLFGALLAYGVQALSDYQLDVFAISGGLAIIFASLAHIGQTHIPSAQITLGDFARLRTWLTVTATGFVLGALVWIAPIDAAWHFSSVGFRQLDNKNVDGFVKNLTQAHELARWESYYSYQLGWVLTEVAQSGDPSQTLANQQKALESIEQAIEANPNQEFGYNAAAWLNLAKQSPQAAEKMFRRVLELVHTKRSQSFGLGLSLLQQGKTDEGIKAIAHEWLNDPIFITSPLWQDPQWKVITPKIAAQWETLLMPAIRANPQLKDIRAAVHWWLGKPGSIGEMANSSSTTAKAIAALTEINQKDRQNLLQPILQNPQTPAEMSIAAWLTPDRRPALLAQAWTTARKEVPDKNAETVIAAMVERMNQAKTFDAWLRSTIPSDSPLNLRSRRQRANFGIISRHIDGINPLDLFNVQENAIITSLFADLFPTQGSL